MKRRLGQLPPNIIGLKVTILKHPDPHLEGLVGTVYWETSRTLWIRVGTVIVKVLKEGGIFAFELTGGRVARVNGEELLGRPEERIAGMRWYRVAGG